MKKEIWKDIQGYKNYYRTSNLGRIKSLARSCRYINGRVNKSRERILKLTLNRTTGYLQVNIHKNKKARNIKVHQIILSTFKKKPSKKHECNHKDGDKQNNNIDNLEWVVRKENILHAYKTGLRKYKALSLIDIQGIKKEHTPYKVTLKFLAEKYNVSLSTIFLAIHNKLPIRNF